MSILDYFIANCSTVPNQKHEKVSKLVLGHVKALMKEIKTPNKVDINAEHPLDPWYENHHHWNYEAANVATKQVTRKCFTICFSFLNNFQIYK